MRLCCRARPLLVLVILLLTVGCARSPEAKKARYLDRGNRYFVKEQYREAIIEYRNALRIDGQNPQATRQLGLAHYQLGQLGQAYAFLLRAQALEPDNSTIALRLATIYLAGGRAGDARTQADRILEKDPKNLEALLLSAGAAETPAELDAAIGRLQAVRSEFDSQTKYYLGLANLYVRKQDLPDAERALQDAIARTPKSPDTHTALGNFYLLTNRREQAELEFRTAADLAPVGSAARVKLADFYILNDQRDQARQILTEITDKAPDFLPAWRLLAELSLTQGKLDDAAKEIETLLKKSPEDLEGRMLRGRLHLARRETDQAVRAFQAIVKSEPRLALARHQLVLAQVQAGNVEQAKAELKEAIVIAPNFAEAVILLAQLNLQSGAIFPAIDGLEKLIARQPATTGAYVLLSRAYLVQRNPARATEVARKLAAVAPRDARGPDLIGRGLLAQGKRAEARRAFEAALALSPEYFDPLFQLVLLDLADKQSAAAVGRIQTQIASAPRSAPHQNLLGEAYRTRGEAKLAESAFLKAIELDPSWTEPYIRLGTLYAASGQYDRALAKVKDAVKADPKNQTTLMVAGVLYEKKGDIPKARESYEQLLAVNPRSVPAANNLAWIYSEYGGDKEKALQLAQMAKQLAPDDPRVSDTLGWILFRRGVYQGALSLLKDSVAKLPDNAQVQYHLGMVYAQLGDQASARKALSAATGSPADFQGKDEARKTLAALK
jgi:tetratricopeptide (TPR) repeat protein